jgi:hypothetical protein
LLGRKKAATLEDVAALFWGCDYGTVTVMFSAAGGLETAGDPEM